MSGCIMINNVFKKIINIRIPIISYIGSNSMVCYIVHYPIMYIMISIFGEAFDAIELWLKFLILSLVVTFFFIGTEFLFRIKKLRFIIGG